MSSVHECHGMKDFDPPKQKQLSERKLLPRLEHRQLAIIFCLNQSPLHFNTSIHSHSYPENAQVGTTVSSGDIPTTQSWLIIILSYTKLA